jgi:TRAP-type C4-dicarboxylate transport system permease large subunit
VFNPFLALTKIPTMLSETLIGTNLSPLGILLILLVAFIVLGRFLEGFAILVLSLPIVHPLIIQLGLAWLGLAWLGLAWLGLASIRSGSASLW